MFVQVSVVMNESGSGSGLDEECFRSDQCFCFIFNLFIDIVFKSILYYAFFIFVFPAYVL